MTQCLWTFRLEGLFRRDPTVSHGQLQREYASEISGSIEARINRPKDITSHIRGATVGSSYTRSFQTPQTPVHLQSIDAAIMVSKIDVHTHALPDFFHGTLRSLRREATDIPMIEWSMDGTNQMMKKAGYLHLDPIPQCARAGDSVRHRGCALPGPPVQ